eukprot:gnl/Spiro4/23843_TR11801_c0_g1_i1.p1 gnl/Spiro4/23843_TR11801_c0_g1~~gnl/Spiro4/23843_TR11801_c0_g1_i1.p1  ORF type:complete len:349 (+),score=59.60 gnl/Spiro4/23843_TR11801_c0_g1_i1:46-1047(+)
MLTLVARAFNPCALSSLFSPVLGGSRVFFPPTTVLIGPSVLTGTRTVKKRTLSSKKAEKKGSGKKTVKLSQADLVAAREKAAQQKALKKKRKKGIQRRTKLSYRDQPTDVKIVEACRAAIAYSKTLCFVPSINMSLVLDLDPRHADQVIRGVAQLPNGTGKKSVSIAVFAKDPEYVKAVQEAGSDVRIGSDDLVAEILEGKIEYEKYLASPDMKTHIAKVARVLGPRGLMPNAKLGTLTEHLGTAIRDLRRGQATFKLTKHATINAPVGVASMTPQQLAENARAVLLAVQAQRPESVKRRLVLTAHLSSTMGPGFKLDLKDMGGEQGAKKLQL